MMRGIIKNIKLHFELICWIAALVALYFLSAGSQHSLCLFSAIGIEACPGCGLGHSIHAALHLRFAESVSYHFFGIPAVLIMLYRIKQLTFNTKTKTAQHE